MTVTIQRLGGLGDGIAEYCNAPLLVPCTAEGDIVSVMIHAYSAGRYYGRMVEVLSPAPARRAPECGYFNDCGGCGLQHLSQEAYRQFKRATLAEALRKSGYNADAVESNIVFLNPAARRRAEFMLLHSPQGIRLAYQRMRSHLPVEVSACAVLAPPLQQWLKAASVMLNGIHGIAAINRVHVTLAQNDAIDLIFFADQMISSKNKQRLNAVAPDLGVCRVALQEGVNTPVVIWQSAPPALVFAGHRVMFPPGAFLQASETGEQAIASVLLPAVPPNARIADLFCGVGTWSFYLARDAQYIHAFEQDERLLQALGEMNIPAIKPIRRDLFRMPLSAANWQKYDVAIINPPRAGAFAQVEEMARSTLSKVAMVSCNPATFARDAAILRRTGFRLASLIGVDQFTYTTHLELVAIFERE